MAYKKGSINFMIFDQILKIDHLHKTCCFSYNTCLNLPQLSTFDLSFEIQSLIKCNFQAGNHYTNKTCVFIDTGCQKKKKKKKSSEKCCHLQNA